MHYYQPKTNKKYSAAPVLWLIKLQEDICVTTLRATMRKEKHLR